MRRESYSNFRDPLSLILRMLRSGDRAAYHALFCEAMRFLTVPGDLLLQPFERRRVESAKASQLPIILIVGTPRSGTTLVYQVLSRYLDVSYFSNLSLLFPRSPISATHLFHQPWRSKRPEFHNYYGQTPGLSAPNDAFAIWNRWLGTDRYEPARSLDDETKRVLTAFFNAWLTTFEKPFLNKNNRNTDCLNLLAESLPTAYFINVQRDPVSNVQSLIAARERVQGDKKAAWGVCRKCRDWVAARPARIRGRCL